MRRVYCKMPLLALYLLLRKNIFDGVTFALSCAHTEMCFTDHEKKNPAFLTAELHIENI